MTSATLFPVASLIRRTILTRSPAGEISDLRHTALPVSPHLYHMPVHGCVVTTGKRLRRAADRDHGASHIIFVSRLLARAQRPAPPPAIEHVCTPHWLNKAAYCPAPQ